MRFGSNKAIEGEFSICFEGRGVVRVWARNVTLARKQAKEEIAKLDPLVKRFKCKMPRILWVKEEGVE